MELEAYKRFRDEKLIPELEEWKRIRGREAKLLEAYKRLEVELDGKGIPETLSLDLGHSLEADLQCSPADTLLLSVGFGFFCEMSLAEAKAFIPKKVAQLRALMGRREAKIAVIGKHLETTERVILELESFE